MLEIPILKEIRSYETKIVGPLSLRGLICMLIAAMGAYGAYFLQIKVMHLSQPIGPIMFVAALPGVVFMVIKPYGLTLEKYLKSAFIDNYVAPKRRPYVQEMSYKVFAGTLDEPTFFDNEDNETVEDAGKKKSNKKNLPPELIAYK